LTKVFIAVTHNIMDYMSYVDAAAKVMRNVITRLKSDEEALKDFKEKCKENSPGVAEFIEGVLEHEPLFCTESDVKEYMDGMRSQGIKTQKGDIRVQIREAVRRLGRRARCRVQGAGQPQEEREARSKRAPRRGGVVPRAGETDREHQSIRISEGEFRDQTAETKNVEKLKPESQKEDEEIVLNAALTLGRIGDSSAVKPLVEVLNSEYPSVRAAAAWALGSIGETSAIKPLELLSGTEKNQWVKGYLREALEKIRV
jgi:hypothetical protein